MASLRPATSGPAPGSGSFHQRNIHTRGTKVVSQVRGQTIDRLTRDIMENDKIEKNSTYRAEIGNQSVDRRPEEPVRVSYDRNRPLSVSVVGSLKKTSEHHGGLTESMVQDGQASTQTPARSGNWDARSAMRSVKKKHYDEAHVDELHNGEREYFDKDMCGFIKGRCICGKCKWPYNPGDKLKYKDFKSLYQKDFIPFKTMQNTPRLDASFYEIRQGRERLDMASTMKTDFKHPPQVDTQSMKPDMRTTYDVPLAGTSSYRASFINYGANIPSIAKHSHRKTVVSELPFLNRTTYRDNFFAKSPANEGRFAPNSR
eukprot:TRINITY_DN15467_c0_g1_i1.p1 TRINITY_DN15467_c0_g1~~TRINITY_DN15467_c0_g1_i1.p1  ORF type:complete len:315 (+),score=50.70 TRINITY_DN15467_c0_g1_i1:64-1008(+)